MAIGGETIKWERRPSITLVRGKSSRVMDSSYTNNLITMKQSFLSEQLYEQSFNLIDCICK